MTDKPRREGPANLLAEGEMYRPRRPDALLREGLWKITAHYSVQFARGAVMECIRVRGPHRVPGDMHVVHYSKSEFERLFVKAEPGA